MVALRAGLDALSLHDVKDVLYGSAVTGSCHACGHDAHTADSPRATRRRVRRVTGASR